MIRGVLHANEPSGYFVYAGYVFTDDETLKEARGKYIHANREIKKALGKTGELKAANLGAKHKRSLFNVMRGYDAVALAVEINRVYDYILADKKSICRYKDYVLKRCVKNKLKRLIADGSISKDEDIAISIFIDEQLTATNGYYDLRDSVREELKHGVVNFDYGTQHTNVFNADVFVEIKYCDSKYNYLIQASDILANRIWTSYRVGNPALRKGRGLSVLTFP